MCPGSLRIDAGQALNSCEWTTLAQCVRVCRAAPTVQFVVEWGMRVFVHLLGVVVLLAGWAALVVLAVLAGTSGSWSLLAVYAVGAAACLFLGLLASARLRSVRRGELPVRRTPSHRA